MTALGETTRDGEDKDEEIRETKTAAAESARTGSSEMEFTTSPRRANSRSACTRAPQLAGSRLQHKTRRRKRIENKRRWSRNLRTGAESGVSRLGHKRTCSRQPREILRRNRR